MVFSAVERSLVWRGPLGFGALEGALERALAGARVEAGVLRPSARAMSSWHLRFSRDFSAAVDASFTAFIYNSAAWIA